ncbi:E3 ubiquitin-protein ligase, partial [Clarias magur]
MITESLGKDLLSFLEKNETVWVSVSVGSRGPVKNLNRGSLVFVSISFIVLMIISSAWLIFYFIQKIRDTNARDRSQVTHTHTHTHTNIYRRLGDAAKKAISKLTTRTVKRGDKETEPDFNHCAVCIEGYQLNDVVRILPCKHVFHKMCVDPWLNEHCTCPMCKLNILKALGIMPNLQCVDNVGFDMERMTRTHSSSQRVALMDVTSETSISVEPLTRSGSSQLLSESELTHTHTHRTGEINIAVTKEWFIVGSFAVLSVLTLCYMIIRATGNTYDNTPLLVFNVSHGALTRFSVELRNNTKGEITELLNQLFNRSYYTQADYLQAWINLQDSVKRQTFLNTHSKDVKYAAVYGVNRFSALSTQQFKDLYLRAHPHEVSKYRFFQDGRLGAPVYPRKFDWRDHGAVGPVRDQKSCGGCWAFSVVSAIESVRVKDGGTFQSLSVQQVLDCAYKSEGCMGGSPVVTLNWLKQ